VPSDAEIAEFAGYLADWKTDPVLMVRDLFRAEPDPWQADALRVFADPTSPRARRIAMQACAGPGKSTVLAWMGWNFLLCYDSEQGHPNGAAVSIDWDNLKYGLWKELSLWREKSLLLQDIFEMTSERIFHRKYPATWFLSARTWSKTADPEAQGRTLSGLHSRSMLFLLDETGDMATAVLRSAEQGMSNCVWGKIATAGNPINLQGLLHTAVSDQSHLWTVITITGDPDDPKCFTRQDKDWAREQIKLYGRDNPWVMAYILGLFPPSSLNALLGPDDVRAAMGRHVSEDVYQFSQKRLGIDVARFGDDATVIFPRQGLAAFNPVEMRNARTPEIAARVVLAKQTWGSELELIDDTGGYGAGVIDQARLGGINLLPINFSGKADDPRYFNKRSEMIFRASEWVKGGGCLPDVPGLIREAVAPTYWFEGGKLRVTEKDQIKKELGKSPDYWDALCLTFALVEMPSRTSPQMIAAGIRGGSRVQDDWNPWEDGR
jgi:hypothetical protein